MKDRIKDLIERFYLVINHFKDYKDYFFSHKKEVYGILREHGILRIKPVQQGQWKLWYNTSYYIGFINVGGEERKVFIKVMGEYLKDCYQNEVLVNNYIKSESKYLRERCPEILNSFDESDYYIIIYEYVELHKIVMNNEFMDNLEMAVSEYNRLGILHTDFGLCNIGCLNGQYFFFDYGTSLCPKSNRIRIRNTQEYNHLDKVSDEALELIADPDFYYDDIVHLGISTCDTMKTKSTSFLVGKNDIVIAKLGKQMINYTLENRAEGSSVKLLVRQ